MSNINTSMLRAEAKRIYKEKAKSVPKKQRMPFNMFFKQYKKMKLAKSQQEDALPAPEAEAQKEDFAFDDFVKMTQISDDNLEVEEPITDEAVDTETQPEIKEEEPKDGGV